MAIRCTWAKMSIAYFCIRDLDPSKLPTHSVGGPRYSWWVKWQYLFTLCGGRITSTFIESFIAVFNILSFPDSRVLPCWSPALNRWCCCCWLRREASLVQPLLYCRPCHHQHHQQHHLYHRHQHLTLPISIPLQHRRTLRQDRRDDTFLLPLTFKHFKIHESNYTTVPIL